MLPAMIKSLNKFDRSRSYRPVGRGHHMTCTSTELAQWVGLPRALNPIAVRKEESYRNALTLVRDTRD